MQDSMHTSVCFGNTNLGEGEAVQAALRSVQALARNREGWSTVVRRARLCRKHRKHRKSTKRRRTGDPRETADKIILPPSVGCRSAQLSGCLRPSDRMVQGGGGDSAPCNANRAIPYLDAPREERGQPAPESLWEGSRPGGCA